MVKSGGEWKTGCPAFLGRYEHTLEAHNRLFVPARIRGADDTGGGRRFILTLSLDQRCLALYPPDAWRELSSRFQSPDIPRAQARAVARLFFSHANPVELDGQGRILIPHPLCALSGLKKDAVIVGVSDHVEIWARERWENYHAKVKGKVARLSEQLNL